MEAFFLHSVYEAIWIQIALIILKLLNVTPAISNLNWLKILTPTYYIFFVYLVSPNLFSLL